MPQVKPGSAAARIAASEAALGGTRSASSDLAGKSAAVAAARNAAMTANAEAPPDAPKARSRWFSWGGKKKAKLAEPIKPLPEPAPEPVLPAAAGIEPTEGTDAPAPFRQRLGKHLKTLLIAASVVIIILGLLQTVMDFVFPSDPPATVEEPTASPPTPAAPPTTPSRPMPAPDGAMPAPGVMPPPGGGPDTTGQINRVPSFFDPSTVLKPPPADVTGSISRQVPTPKATSPAAPSTPPATAVPHPASGLPASIGGPLRIAAAAGDPAAEYEIALRYSEGRGVTQSNADAHRWLERAAKAGFVPAQFRLASLNEKGDGLKKDLATARRLYLAAADKGHAKAMHNLAVLHAEGIDGKPDYKAAAQWFRKAAGYGIADSQFNLAILYARGIGIEQNLAESYKWFALAAAKGDQDAAKKRDEVAARLDPQTLNAARLAAQTFVAEMEPEEAVGLKVPAGGWDRPTGGQPTKPKARTRTPAAE